jgi:hypothetical protein
LLIRRLVQNADVPMTVTVLLIAADRRAERASVSTSITVATGDPHWQARLADAVASRAREGAERLGAELAPEPSLPASRFVPLAAVLPAVRIAH